MKLSEMKSTIDRAAQLIEPVDPILYGLLRKVENALEDRALTSYQVAKMLQVNASSVNKWATDGKLEHYRTPGSHRRFLFSAVMAFCKSHGMPLRRLPE